MFTTNYKYLNKKQGLVNLLISAVILIKKIWWFILFMQYSVIHIHIFQGVGWTILNFFREPNAIAGYYFFLEAFFSFSMCGLNISFRNELGALIVDFRFAQRKFNTVFENNVLGLIWFVLYNSVAQFVHSSIRWTIFIHNVFFLKYFICSGSQPHALVGNNNPVSGPNAGRLLENQWQPPLPVFDRYVARS